MSQQNDRDQQQQQYYSHPQAVTGFAQHDWDHQNIAPDLLQSPPEQNQFSLSRPEPPTSAKIYEYSQHLQAQATASASHAGFPSASPGFGGAQSQSQQRMAVASGSDNNVSYSEQNHMQEKERYETSISTQQQQHNGHIYVDNDGDRQPPAPHMNHSRMHSNPMLGAERRNQEMLPEANRHIMMSDNDQQQVFSDDEAMNNNQVNIGDYPSDEQRYGGREREAANVLMYQTAPLEQSNMDQLTMEEIERIMRKRRNQMINRNAMGGTTRTSGVPLAGVLRRVPTNRSKMPNLDLSRVSRRNSAFSPGSQTRNSDHSQLFNQSPAGSQSTRNQMRTPKQKLVVHTLQDSIKNSNMINLRVANTARHLQTKHGHRDDLDDHTTIIETSMRGNTKERTAYNISDYRTACRTCKDMEVEEYEKINVKKTYKRGNLLNVPNTGLSKMKKTSTTASGTFKPVKPSIDLEKAREKLNAAKGKVAPTARFNVNSLKKLSFEKLIEIILLLQDENDRLRVELDKLRIKVQLSDKKGQQINSLKTTIKMNKQSLELARQQLKDGYKLIILISSLVDEILQAFRLSAKKQQTQLPQLLRKLKVLLEGQYQPSQQQPSSLGKSTLPGGVRHGKTGLTRLQMQDEQNRLNESSLSHFQPTASIKEGLEQLITAMGFEAHKNEALINDTKDQDRKFIEEQFEAYQKELDSKKEQFQKEIRRENRETINELKSKESLHLRDLENYQLRIKELEDQVDRMNKEIQSLRIMIDQEQDKYFKLDQDYRALQQRNALLNKTLDDKAKHIEQLNNRHNEQVIEISNLEEINKRLRAEKEALKVEVEQLQPLKMLKLDKDSIQPKLDYVKQEEQKMLKQREELEKEIEGYKKIQQDNARLQTENLKLSERMASLEEEAAQLRESIKQIPELQNRKKEMKDHITELEVKLQDANFEKNRLKDELENKNLIEIRQIASSLTQILMQKNDRAFSEKQITLFKTMMGTQIVDQWRNRLADADQDRLFSEMHMSPNVTASGVSASNANGEKAVEAINRATFRLNDSAQNEAALDQLMPKKHLNSSRLGTGRSNVGGGNETTNIGRGLGIRKQSIGSLSQNPKSSSRQKKRSSNQVNRSMNQQDLEHELPPRPFQGKQNQQIVQQQSLEFNQADPANNRQTLPIGMGTHDDDYCLEGENDLFSNIDKNNDDGADVENGKKAKKDKRKKKRVINSNNISGQIFSAGDAPFSEAENVARDSQVRPAIVIEKHYYADEDVLQMLHLQALTIEEKFF